MDDVMVRSRYPRHSIPAKRRSRYGKEKSKLPGLIFKQLVACIILLLVIIMVKNINSSFTNFLSDKVRFVLEQNIDLNSVFKSVDNAVGKLKGDSLIEDNSEDKDKTENDTNSTGIQAKESDTKIPETSVLSATTENGSNLTAGMVIPVKGVLTSPFGERKDPVTGIVKQHEGIDIDANDGDGISAVLDGTVVDTGNSKTYGKYIKIRHDERFETVYAHCSVVSVVQGQKVVQGDIVGKVGNTGASVGSHLHFEVWKDGKPVNPLDYINIPQT
jgi:Membrane proteins related to metalloendopeptidases